MINYCYIQGCKNRNICTVYNTLIRYQKDMVVDISSCKYLNGNQQLPSDVKIPVSLTERIKEIKTLSHSKRTDSTSKTITEAKLQGMQFTIDDG